METIERKREIPAALVAVLNRKKRPSSGLAGSVRTRGCADRWLAVRHDRLQVQYVLMTANTWKTPIRDFELIVDRPEGRGVSFCWDGKVEKVSRTAFSAKANDFVPAKDLGIYSSR